jgi:hypothetical protein
MKSTVLTIAAVLALIIHCKGQNIAQAADHQPGPTSSKDTIANYTPLPAIPANDDIFNVAYKEKKIRQVPWFVEKFKLSAGFFMPVNNTNIRVSGDAGEGTDIDFENDLGFNKTSSAFYSDFQWRSSSRSRFDLTYYGIFRSSNHTIQKDIIFGDASYNVNSNISAFFNTNIYRFSYGYAIVSEPTWEAGLLIGAHIVRFNVGLDVQGSNVNASASQNFGVTAPLPDFGVWGGVALGPKWALNGEFDYLSITIDNVTGKILGYNFAVTFKPFKQLSFAAGYTGLNFSIDATHNEKAGNLQWDYNGPTIMAIFSFGKKGWE